MDAKELKQKTAEELKHLADAHRGEIRDLRFKANLRSLRTVRQLRDKRRELARILQAIDSQS